MNKLYCMSDKFFKPEGFFSVIENQYQAFDKRRKNLLILQFWIFFIFQYNTPYDGKSVAIHHFVIFDKNIHTCYRIHILTLIYIQNSFLLYFRKLCRWKNIKFFLLLMNAANDYTQKLCKLLKWHRDYKNFLNDLS